MYIQAFTHQLILERMKAEITQNNRTKSLIEFTVIKQAISPIFSTLISKMFESKILQADKSTKAKELRWSDAAWSCHVERKLPQMAAVIVINKICK